MPTTGPAPVIVTDDGFIYRLAGRAPPEHPAQSASAPVVARIAAMERRLDAAYDAFRQARGQFHQPNNEREAFKLAARSLFMSRSVEAITEDDRRFGQPHHGHD